MTPYGVIRSLKSISCPTRSIPQERPSSSLPARDNPGWIDPADITVRPAVNNVTVPMSCVTKHEKCLFGKVHMHYSITYRHGSYTCRHFRYDSRSSNVRSTIQLVLRGQLRV